MSVGLRADIRPRLPAPCPHCTMTVWCGRLCAHLDVVQEAMGFTKPKRACLTCGASLEGKHHWAKYCGAECKSKKGMN